MNNLKQGFTLAEVLITLVIIGVIAAITIPSLMNKTNEQEYVVGAKKTYSVLSQAFQKIIAENGDITPSLFGSSPAEATKNFGDMLAKQLNVQKICGVSTDEDCFAKGFYKKMDGSDYSNWNETTYYKMRLSDGTSLAVRVLSEYSERGTSEPLKYVIGYGHFDVNGDKAPNTHGIDTFPVWITKYGFVPFGTPFDNEKPFSDCKTNGDPCAAWVLTKGNMDYLHKDVSW